MFNENNLRSRETNLRTTGALVSQRKHLLTGHLGSWRYSIFAGFYYHHLTKIGFKFVLHLKDEETDSVTEIAFLDGRRLGRIRLCAEPLKESPISDLGFDPILSMSPLDEFQASVLKRGCPIKALLLDQSFSAGIGNWVAGQSTLVTTSEHKLTYPKMRFCTTPEYTLNAVVILLRTLKSSRYTTRFNTSVRLL